MIHSKADHPSDKVTFGGESTEVEAGNSLDKSEALIKRAIWRSQERVYTQAVDLAFSGYNTFNTNGLRLWRALPSFEKKSPEVENESSSDEEDVF